MGCSTVRPLLPGGRLVQVYKGLGLGRSPLKYTRVSTAQRKRAPVSPSPTHHNEVPHPRGLSHKRGHGAAARHEDDLDGVAVEQLIQVLGGLARVTLRGWVGTGLRTGSPRAPLLPATATFIFPKT